MVHVTASIVIERPVEEVFDFVADQRNEPSYNPGMRRCRLLTDEPIGRGSRFAATMRARPREIDMVCELTGYEPPRRLESRTGGTGTVATGSLSFEPVGDATRMSWDWQVRPTGVMRLLTPMLALVGGRFERSIWSGLKVLLESPSRAA